MTKRTLFAALILCAALPGAAHPRTPTPQEVVAFVEKAVAHIGAVGEEKAYEDFSDLRGKFVEGELYIFCHDFLTFSSVAHGGTPSLRGKSVIGFKDPDGRPVNQLIFEKVKADGKGWVEYKWPHPVTKTVVPKAVYATRVNDRVLCGSGYYRPEN